MPNIILRSLNSLLKSLSKLVSLEAFQNYFKLVLNCYQEVLHPKIGSRANKFNRQCL
jgi:hypothetical protein